MRPAARLLTFVLALGIGAQAAVLWNATGRHVFTADSRATHDAVPSLAELFGDTGLEDATGPMPEPAPGSRLGLLPSSPDHRAVSVLTVAGPAAIIALYALISRAPRARTHQGDAPR